MYMFHASLDIVRNVNVTIHPTVLFCAKRLLFPGTTTRKQSVGSHGFMRHNIDRCPAIWKHLRLCWHSSQKKKLTNLFDGCWWYNNASILHENATKVDIFRPLPTMSTLDLLSWFPKLCCMYTRPKKASTNLFCQKYQEKNCSLKNYLECWRDLSLDSAAKAIHVMAHNPRTTLWVNFLLDAQQLHVNRLFSQDHAKRRLWTDQTRFTLVIHVQQFFLVVAQKSSLSFRTATAPARCAIKSFLHFKRLMLLQNGFHFWWLGKPHKDRSCNQSCERSTDAFNLVVSSESKHNKLDTQLKKKKQSPQIPSLALTDWEGWSLLKSCWITEVFALLLFWSACQCFFLDSFCWNSYEKSDASKRKLSEVKSGFALAFLLLETMLMEKKKNETTMTKKWS